MSPIRISPTIRSARWRRSSTRCRRRRSMPARPISTPPISRSSASTSAIRRPTSFPARSRLVFNVRFNDLWTPATLERRDRAARRRGGERRALRAAFDPTNAVAFLTARGAFTDLVARAIEETTGGRRSCRPAAARRTRASSRTPARSSSSASSARPCTRSTSASRSTTSRRFRASTSARWSSISPTFALGIIDPREIEPAGRRDLAAAAAVGRLERRLEIGGASILPSPTSTSEPTIERTCRCRNDSAATRKFDPFALARQRRAATACAPAIWPDIATSRKVEKSWRPISALRRLRASLRRRARA